MSDDIVSRLRRELAEFHRKGDPNRAYVRQAEVRLLTDAIAAITERDEQYVILARACDEELMPARAEITRLRTALEAAEQALWHRKDCPKCGGAGWLWGKELDAPDERTATDTMTQYQCDWPEHRALAPTEKP